MEEFITDKFQTLLDDINTNLEKKPGRVIAVVPGNQVIWDDCCKGQLTARLVSLTPVLTGGSSITQCGIKWWQAVGEITLVRCAATLNDNGSAPKPGVLLAEGRDALKDTDTIIKSIGTQDWIQSIGGWTPAANTGGCRGISITFNFNLDHPS